MTVTGTWVLTLSGPHGRQHLVVALGDDVGGLAGSVTVDGERMDLGQLRLDGNQLLWVQPAIGSLSLELTVEVTVRGDTMTGRASGHGSPGQPTRLSVLGMRSLRQA